ncbi:alpha-E domain-containing protein [Blastochloris sulfoviridis]|uniref:Alpha-E domain-containing protein n=1 Tax=Blastochloris sulfoviridis TaxID=50712 RepID=A0A5M6I3B0_9HYPH|nr:alpha-E domain-containing protein [Blastochloris sulfoviridis]KAA5602694.1 alpha-E domain-containing protein [Blastochloris sulfoviridis]
MLSRTADNLYWLARYIERAEFVARTIEVAQRMASLPTSYGGSSNEWESALATTGCADSFHKHYRDATERTVTEFLAFSPENSSSIVNCLETARANARAVRTALTVEMWEAINDVWLELKKLNRRKLDRDDVNRFLNKVKEASLLFDGSASRTMLRRDSYWFERLGHYIERADNTARILDVKYHLLLPDQSHVGGALDYYQWTSVLRAVSAVTSFHWVYRESVKPWLVADFLILNEQMPRSLASCYENITRYLDMLAQGYGRQGPAQRHARAMRARLQNARMEAIFGTGLHEFITGFLADNHRLGSEVTEQYLV